MVGVWWKRLALGFLAATAFAAIPMRTAWRDFQKKSRASEAKTNLSGIFTAMKSFGGEY